MSLEFELLLSSVVVTVLGAGAMTGAGCTTTVSCDDAGGTYAAVVLVTSVVFALHPLMKGKAARPISEIAIVTNFFIGLSLMDSANENGLATSRGCERCE
jgi:hypothetical protein